MAPAQEAALGGRVNRTAISRRVEAKDGRPLESRPHYPRLPGAHLALIGLLLLQTIGCAGVFSGSPFGAESGARKRPVPPLRIIRDERAADYDVLIGESAAAEGDFELARAAYERAAEKDPEAAFLHDRLARLAWQLEDVEGAVAEAELAFELAPDDLEIRLFLGRLYRLRRDFDGLDRVLRDAAGRPLDADSAYALFQVALERRDYIKAENLARQLAELEPDQLRGRLGLATVYEQKKDFDSAEEVVRRGLEAFPDHFLLFMRLAQIERERGDPAGEIAVYREVLASHPNHYGILQRLGQAQLDMNNLEGAIEAFGQVVESYPEDVNSLRRLASIEFSAGRYTSAADRLEAFLTRSPNQPELIFALGQIRRALEDDPGALEAFNRIGPAEANYIDARLQIAALLEIQGNTVEALAEIDRLRELRPNRQLDFHAAALRIELGNFDDGVALLEGALTGTDEDLEVLYQLGVLYGGQDKTDDALRYMQRVLALDPDSANALNYIGYSWAERGENLDEAEKLIRRAIEIEPEDGYITDSLGWVYYKMAEGLFAESRKEEALRALEQAHEQLLQAAKLTGGDSVVSEHLGDVFLLRGDKSGALDYYEEAVELELREEEQPNLLEKLDQLRRDLGSGAGGANAAQ